MSSAWIQGIYKGKKHYGIIFSSLLGSSLRWVHCTCSHCDGKSLTSTVVGGKYDDSCWGLCFADLSSWASVKLLFVPVNYMFLIFILSDLSWWFPVTLLIPHLLSLIVKIKCFHYTLLRIWNCCCCCFPNFHAWQSGGFESYCPQWWTQPSHKLLSSAFRRHMRTLTHTTPDNPSQIFLSLMQLVHLEHVITLRH